MNYLKQSTAATIKLGPFVDDTDGKTAETGLTISQADIRLSKNGGDFAQTNNAAGATHDENGYYDVPLDTTDTGTLGRLRVAVSESGALPVWQDFLVVVANVYDSLCSTDVLDVSVTQIAGSAVSTTSAQLGVNVVQISEDATAANNAESFFDGTGYAGTNNVIPTVTTLTGHTAQTGDAYARLGAPAGASVSADIAAVKSDTGAILTDTGTDLPATLATIAGYIDTEVAAVLAAVDTEVAAIKAKTDNLPTDPADQSAVEAAITAATSPLATAADLAVVDGVVDAILVDTGTTLDAAIADLPTNAELAAALAGADDATLAAIAALNNVSSGDVQTAAAAALTAYDPPTKAELDAAAAPLALQTSVDDLESRLTATRAGYLDNLSAGPVATAAALDAVDGNVDDILTDTGTTLPATLATLATAAALDAVDNYVDTEVAAIKAVTDKLDTTLVQDGAVYDFTAAALAASPTGGSAPTAVQIRQEIDANSTQLAAILEDTGTTLDALIKDVPTVAEFEARTLAAASYFDPAADTVTVGANNDKTGYALADATSDAVIADAIWNAAKAGYGTAGTYGEHLEGLANSSDPSAATIAAQVRTELTTELARIDAAISTRLAGASYTAPDNASITAILEDTGATLPATLAGLATQVSVDDLPTNAELATALAGADDATLAAIAALNNVSSGDVQTAAAAALTAYDPPTKAELDSAVSPLATAAALDAVDNYVDTEVAAIKAVTDKLDTTLVQDGAVYDFTAAALAASPTGGSAPTAVQIRQEIDANSTQLAAIVEDTGTTLPAAVAALPTAASVADAVWDEATAGHAATGTTGKALTDAQSAGDPWATALPGAYGAGTAGAIVGNVVSTVTDAVWDEALSGHTTAGTAGDALGDVEADVWSHATRTLTQTAASVTAAVTGSALTITRGDTWTASLTGLADMTGRSKVWFAVKASKNFTDAQAILLIELAAGLTVVNGAAYTTVANGSITIDSSTALTIVVKPAVTSVLTPAAPLYYEVQMLETDGSVHTLTAGECRIEADVVRAIA